MKSSFIIIMMILILSSIVMAEINLYNNTPLGYEMDEVPILGSSGALDLAIENIQTYNAEGGTQLLTKQAINEYKLASYNAQIGVMYDLIVSLFILTADVVVLLMYIIEMRLILFLFVELLPNTFVKLRDALGGFFLRRGT